MGWDNLPRRLKYLLEVRAGVMQRRTAVELFSEASFEAANGSPATDQKQVWAERASRFFAMPTQGQLKQLVPGDVWRENVTAVCENALAGNYPFFSNWTGEIGWPPNFNLDPVNQIQWPADQHWTKITKSGPPRDDIKLVWEASRFSLAYYFAREYVHSGDERWAEAFWQMLDAWIEQNPVNQTAAWGCGQEVSFRVMAILFGAFATRDSAAASCKRLRKLELLCWQFGKRILANIDYAISQKNNHALSEATGLWTLGLVFPEFSDAKGWLRRAERVFRSEAKRQIYDDGSFVQHSMNYHRVMLDDLSWSIRLGRINNNNVDDVVVDRFRLAVNWLHEFVCPVSGRVPNYGPNDGAQVLPLACSDYLDYRPSLQLASCVADGQRCIDPGTHDESALWLGVLSESSNEPGIQQEMFAAERGGYYVMRGADSMLMLRCCDYLDRPNQADNMHVDVWYKGENVLRDAGSFRYYHSDSEMKSYFYSVRAHNAAQFDDVEQMLKGPRFLWLAWPKAIARVIDNRHIESTMTTRVQPTGTHHRNISRFGDVFRIEDAFEYGGEVTVRWRILPDLQWIREQRDEIENRWNCQIAGDEYALVVISDKTEIIETEGMESLYYGQSRTCPTLEFKGKIESLVTFVGPVEELDPLVVDYKARNKD